MRKRYIENITQIDETLYSDPVVIVKCLGHKMLRIVTTYNKNEMRLQRQEALEKWAECIQNLVQQEIQG